MNICSAIPLKYLLRVLLISFIIIDILSVYFSGTSEIIIFVNILLSLRKKNVMNIVDPKATKKLLATLSRFEKKWEILSKLKALNISSLTLFDPTSSGSTILYSVKTFLASLKGFCNGSNTRL